MTAGMKIIEIAGRIFHADKVVAHRISCKFPQMLVRRAGIERIRRMGDKLGNPRISGKLGKGCGIFLVDLLGRAAAGISCEKGKSIGSDALGGPSHREISARRRKMTSDSKHMSLLIRR